jgi:hypothetical protein
LHVILPSQVFIVAISFPFLVSLCLRFNLPSTPYYNSESPICSRTTPVFNDQLIWCNHMKKLSIAVALFVSFIGLG